MIGLFFETRLGKRKLTTDDGIVCRSKSESHKIVTLADDLNELTWM
jgi:hypothetical protein